MAESNREDKTEITIKDIAKKCGVGVSTVSRAINNHPDINQATRQMIMDVIEKTGFIPNNNARNLKRIDARCIAILVKGLVNPLFVSMIQVIEEEIQKKKYALVLRHVEAYEDEADVALALVKEKRLRGIIFLGGAFRHEQAKLSKLKVPFVFSTIGRDMTGTEGELTYSNIAVDDRVESRRMTEYLLNLGHRKIAIITEGSEEPSVGQLRLAGYEDAFRERGMEVDSRLIWYVEENISHYSLENGYLTAKKILAADVGATAVYATADLLAIGACRAILEAGKRIPEDISVVGYDGISLGEYYNPKLTTIEQPAEDMAKETISLLFHVIEGREAHKQIIFEAKLLERESAAAPKS